MEWGLREFGNADLGNIRRSRRLVTVASELSKGCCGTLPDTFSNWAQLKAAYRFMENPSISYRQIIEPH